MYIYIYRRVDICRTAHRVLNSKLERSRCVKQINSIFDLSFYYYLVFYYLDIFIFHLLLLFYYYYYIIIK